MHVKYLKSILLSLACLIYVSVQAARLSPENLTFEIQGLSEEYFINDDINFKIHLSTNTYGEVVNWETSSLYMELYKTESRDVDILEISPHDHLFTEHLDSRAERSISIPGAFEYERGVTMGPKPECQTVYPGTPYFLDVNFHLDVYSSPYSRQAKFLEPGFYKLVISYFMHSPGDPEYDDEKSLINAVAIFRVTTKNSVEETIEYWLSILLDSDEDEEDVKGAWSALDNYTEQTFKRHTANMLDTTVRVNGVMEYQRWFENNSKKIYLAFEDGYEYLEEINPPECLSCYEGVKITRFGDELRSTDQETINLKGGIVLGHAGLESLIIENSLKEGRLINAERTSYTGWSADVPLLIGENILTLTTKDYIGKKLSKKIKIIRTEP